MGKSNTTQLENDLERKRINDKQTKQYIFIITSIILACIGTGVCFYIKDKICSKFKINKINI